MSDSNVVMLSGECGEQGQVDNDLMPNSVELSVSVLTNTFVEGIHQAVLDSMNRNINWDMVWARQANALSDEAARWASSAADFASRAAAAKRKRGQIY